MQLVKQKITLPAMFGITADVEEKRNEFVLASKAVKSVTTGAEQDLAVSAARDIRTWLKEVETARVTLTKPLLETQRQLKALADDHCAPLIEEQRRVERLVTMFQEAETRRVAEEERKRQEAYAKAERERVAAEEAARKAAEKATTEKQLFTAIKKEEVAIAAAVKVQDIIAAPLPEAMKSKGAATRKVLKWEVTDLNALVKARPDLCKIEPKASAIQATCIPEMPNLPPGLKLWWENQTSIRSY
jgi:hypothetical protein